MKKVKDSIAKEIAKTAKGLEERRRNDWTKTELSYYTAGAVNAFDDLMLAFGHNGLLTENEYQELDELLDEVLDIADNEAN